MNKGEKRDKQQVKYKQRSDKGCVCTCRRIIVAFFTGVKMTDKQGMGFGRFWRMFSEKNRQGLADLGLHSALGDTKPTPMQRAQYMRKEASDFANKIRMCEKDIRGLKLANESFLKTCKSVLSSPLPRVCLILHNILQANSNNIFFCHECSFMK